ncbi:L-threonylcarbamoyladenylate synthase [Calderihabitans maritimus]|uniref:Threonylcarbamoyl-AMP synthase n=1 Tax=Calderihabitans maritimus TaxID=1246530 RepID=A0A1Z5HX14_9FIRM|nr:L-threonylcarbamoyladenylate synthase [Calderihabitans maritimus]GAW93820.1 translation factor SUA5 [Calderihabitans maritimus]
MGKIVATQYLVVNPVEPEPDKIEWAARVLREGGLVAFPTETVYGLGANALNREAVRKIFQAKGRPADNPLIVHVGSLVEVDNLVTYVPEKARRLMQLFWPGPLTLVLPRRDQVPLEVTAGLETVAIRMPDHPVALALLRTARVPVAAPSANRSGRPSPTTGQHVLADLQGKVDVVLDGGAARVGVESTVLDLTTEVPVILRPGGATVEQLREVLGEVALDPALEKSDPEWKPRSPGMKYTHYSPEAEVFLVAGSPRLAVQKILELCKKWQERGERVAILATEETADYYRRGPVVPDHIEILGSRRNLEEIARRLFNALRNCDLNQATVVLAETFPDEGIGLAIMNRLRKAAGGRVISS